MKIIVKVLNLGFSITGSIILGTFLGYWLDKLLNTKPIFMIIGILFGTIGGLLYLLEMVKNEK